MVYNSEDMKTTQVPTEKGMDKETVTHILYGVQLSHYKGLKSTFCTIFFSPCRLSAHMLGWKRKVYQILVILASSLLENLGKKLIRVTSHLPLLLNFFRFILQWYVILFIAFQALSLLSWTQLDLALSTSQNAVQQVHKEP